MKIIAMVDCAAGNETVGTEWVEVKTFSEDAQLKDILAWQKSLCSGSCSNIRLAIEKE